MPLPTVPFRPFLRAAALAGLTMLALTGMAAAQDVPPPIDSSLQGSPAYQAQVSTPATTTSTTGTTAASSSFSNIPADCFSESAMCNPAHCQAYANGRQQALMLDVTRNTEYFKFSVSAAYAAACVGKLYEY